MIAGKVKLDLMRSFVSKAVYLVWMSASTVGAQTLGITPGATVRFQIVADDSFRSGIMSRLTPDSLALATCQRCMGRLLYSRGEITRIDVLQRTATGNRIVNGILIGGAAGLGLGWLSTTGCSGGDKCDFAILAIPFGAIAGAIIGGAAGYLTSYKWEPVSLSQ